MNKTLIRHNEVGMSINNHLNHKSINASFDLVWFYDNTYDDLKIIDASDISIRNSTFAGSSDYGITLINTILTEFNDCTVRDKKIGMDIKTTYPFHPGFNLGDDTGVSNQFISNNSALQLGGGIGVGNTNDLEIFRGIFQTGGLGVEVLGSAGYKVYSSSFPSVKYGIVSAHSGISENSIHCNIFSDVRNGIGIATLGDNRNLTMHSNEFNMSDDFSLAIWRLNGDIFRVQSANFNINILTPFNPPAGNQFFDVGFDLNFSTDGNTVDYLVPQSGAGVQYYPQTISNYNSIFSNADIFACPVDNNFTGDIGDSIPNNFEPNDSTGNWQDPIGDPISLDEYLAYLISLDFGEEEDGTDGHTRSEIARVRYALYRWVVYMLEHPSNFDLLSIEDFVDGDYQRLLVGYYIQQQDPHNADRILASLPRIEEVDSDFVSLQEINLKRLFPAFYNFNTPYIPTNIELQNIRTIAEQYSENTGYASALYYIYTNEKVYPEFDFYASLPRNVQKIPTDNALDVKIFPSPTNGKIEINANREINHYTLYDRFGRLQLSNFVKGSKSFNLDISEQVSGIFFLQVKCGNEIITKRVIKI